jgi:hypothetical protein
MDSFDLKVNPKWFIQLIEQLQSLSNLLNILDDNQYTRNNRLLGNASIGGHTRHIIELLKCAVDGYSTGKVDYINRSRNLSLESERITAMRELENLKSLIIKADRELKLAVESQAPPVYVSTTFSREIVYNTEHTIHHLALIRVALREMNLDIVGDVSGGLNNKISLRASIRIV